MNGNNNLNLKQYNPEKNKKITISENNKELEEIEKINKLLFNTEEINEQYNNNYHNNIKSIEHINLEDDVVVYIEEPSNNLICPIHKELFNNPVIAKCGHTFCKDCISKSINSENYIFECPIDKTIFKNEDLNFLIPNLVVVDSILLLKTYCKYGCKKEGNKWVKNDNGCPEILPYNKKKEHEKQCLYSTTKCPYNNSCPPIRKMDLENHIKICENIPCPYKKFGCYFKGKKENIEEHTKICSYETIKGFILVNKKKFSKIKENLRKKDEENKILQNNISLLKNTINIINEKFENKTIQLESIIQKITNALNETQENLHSALNEIDLLKKRIRKKQRDADDINADMGIKIEYEPINLNCKGTFTGHSGPVWSLAISQNGLLISASSDTTIKIWDIANFKCKKTLVGHEGIVHAVVVHENKLCSGSSDKSIRIWDLNTMQCIKIIKIHDNTVCSLAISEKFLFSGSYTEIKVWNLENYQCIQTLTGHNHWVRALTTANNYLYSGSYNIIKIWDLSQLPFQCIRTITGNNGSIYSIVIAKEYKYLITGTYENIINIYDLENYKCIQSLSGHIGAIYALSVSGNRFFSGSYDSTIKVWNLDNFKCLQTLVRHSSSVDALVSAAGCIFSGSADHSVKVWM